MVTTPTTNTQLLGMSYVELTALFRTLQPGPIPTGQAAGRAIIATDTVLTPLLSTVVKLVVWQGKTFDARRGLLINRLVLGLIQVVLADVYVGPSWIDGQPCIVLDYSGRSVIANRVRDEIRMLRPGFYFGPVYVGPVPMLHFSLTFGS
jgi:hypothetical protein